MKALQPIDDDSEFAAGPTEPSADEALRLLRAFASIADPETQAEVLALAERYASKSPQFAAALQRLKTRH
jgi:hypothetical protein